MKTYYLNILGCMLALASLIGCIDDRGNYDYLSKEDVMPIQISGLEDSYQTLIGDKLKLTATVAGDEGMDNVEYGWYLFQTVVAEKRDTLGYGRQLDWTVDCESGFYYLLFEARDLDTGLFTYKKMNLEVNTTLSNVWVLLESDGTGVDMDVVKLDGETMEDMITSGGGTRLQGNPVNIQFQNRHCQEVEHADGTVEVERKKAFIVTTDRDMRVYNGINMELMKPREDCFYEMPSTLQPRNYASEGTQDQLNNNGKYYILGQGNIGKFGYPLMGPDGTEDYDLHADWVAISQAAYLWEKNTHSFLYAYFSNSSLSYFDEAKDGETNYGPVKNLEADLQRMLYRSSELNTVTYKSTANTYALMKQPDGSHCIYDLRFQKSTAYPLNGIYTLPEGCLLGQSTCMAAHHSAPKIFFATNGNELWEHNVNSNSDPAARERKVYAFPAGETIAYIRHVYSSQSLDDAEDTLVIITNSPDGWKLYGIRFIGGGSEFDGSVAPDDYLLGKGKGKGACVLRMYTDTSY